MRKIFVILVLLAFLIVSCENKNCMCGKENNFEMKKDFNKIDNNFEKDFRVKEYEKYKDYFERENKRLKNEGKRHWEPSEEEREMMKRRFEKRNKLNTFEKE